MAEGVGFPWDMPKVLQFGCATKVCRSSRLGDRTEVLIPPGHLVEMAEGVGFPWDMPKVLQFGCATKVCRSSRLGDRTEVLIPPDHLYEMAEGVGFEPTVPFSTSVFKTDAIDHSTTPPKLSR